MIRALGHAAVWTGLYTGAVVVCTLRLAGTSLMSTRACLGVLGASLLGQAVYLLDRVKLRDALLDVGDELAHPRRFAFVHRYRYPLRRFVVVEGIAAALLLAMVHPLLVPLVPAAFAGVVVYAGLPRDARLPPRNRRIKDLLVVKNLAVALSMTALGLAVALGVDRSPTTGDLLFAGAFVLLLVFADSMLCDLDDRPADRAFGTRTLAWCASPGFVRMTALAIHALLVPMAVVLRPATPAPGWALMLLVGTVGLVLVPEGYVRDAVDLRLPITAALAATILPA